MQLYTQSYLFKIHHHRNVGNFANPFDLLERLNISLLINQPVINQIVPCLNDCSVSLSVLNNINNDLLVILAVLLQ